MVEDATLSLRILRVYQKIHEEGIQEIMKLMGREGVCLGGLSLPVWRG
jgi:hypothetical protein